jgi:hypothetical protein
MKTEDLLFSSLVRTESEGNSLQAFATRYGWGLMDRGVILSSRFHFCLCRDLLPAGALDSRILGFSHGGPFNFYFHSALHFLVCLHDSMYDQQASTCFFGDGFVRRNSPRRRATQRKISLAAARRNRVGKMHNIGMTFRVSTLTHVCSRNDIVHVLEP